MVIRLLRSCPVVMGALGALIVLPLVLAQGPTTGKRYAVLVGIKDYDHAKLKPLDYPENDVDDLAGLLGPAGYEVVLLTNSAGRKDAGRMPTLANIEARLDEVLEKCKRHDTVLVGLAGHGLQFEKAQPTDADDAYFCPQDARPLPERRETLLSLKGLYRRLDKSGAGVKLLLVDACRDDPQPGRGRGVDGSTAPRPPKGVAALFSCSAGERAFESDKVKHGVFFHYVLEGLRGQAKNDENEVTWDSLQQYVRRRVSRDVSKLIGDVRQTPTLNAGELAGEPPVLLTVKNTPVPRDNAEMREEAQSLTVELGGGVKMEFVRIPAGKFTMGSPGEEKKRSNDEVQHEVTISRSFYLGKYEVTQEQYEAVTGENPSKFKKVEGEDTRRFPVENVSWEEATAYCRKLTEKAGRGTFALPTEGQWEYACRAGTETPFHFGDKLNGREANCDGNYPYGTSAKGPYLERPCRVGSYAANRWGLYDMHGNVWEWCKDWYGKYSGGTETDPTGPAEGSDRVGRGGSWYDDAGDCRAASRSRGAPGYRSNDLGFRVALSSVR